MSAEQPPAGGRSRKIGSWASAADGRRRGHNVWVVLLALVGGAITWCILEYASPVFTVPKEYHVATLTAPPEKHEALKAVQAQVARRNAMLEMACFGALVAGMIALAEGASWRSLKAVGVGGVGGCVGGLVGRLTYSGPLVDLTATVKTQALMLATLGIAVGVAVGFARNSLRRAATAGGAGMLAGLTAGAVYPVVISLFLPGANTDAVVPEGAVERLLWLGITTILLGYIVGGTTGRRKTPVESTT